MDGCHTIHKQGTTGPHTSPECCAVRSCHRYERPGPAFLIVKLLQRWAPAGWGVMASHLAARTHTNITPVAGVAVANVFQPAEGHASSSQTTAR
jgi:hypothetical protein